MKRETFVKIIKSIQTQYAKEDKVANFWRDTFGEYFPDFTADLQDQVINALDTEYDTELISWWLWDAPSGISDLKTEYAYVIEDGERFELDTLEKLYNYLEEK